MITINPDKIAQFQNLPNEHFYVITSKAIGDDIKIADSKRYKDTQKVVIDENELYDFIQHKVPDNSDILVIPYAFTRRVGMKKEQLTKQKRALVLVTESVAYTVTKDIVKFNIKMAESLNIEKQEALSKQFFETLKPNDVISFQNQTFQTEATLTLDQKCGLSKIFGYVQYEQCKSTPIAETSITHTDNALKNIYTTTCDNPAAMQLNGDLLFQGYITMSRKAPVVFLPPKQLDEFFDKLATVGSGAIKTTLKDGRITHMECLDKSAEPAYRAFNSLFELDPRFNVLIEIGFALDTVNPFYTKGNNPASEFYGADNGCIHFGLGSVVTLVHFDVLCPDTVAISPNGQTFGQSSEK